MSFICHIHNYTEYNQQWNVFSAFNPSKCTHTVVNTHTHTPGAVDTHTHTHTLGAVDTHTHTHTHLEQWTHTHTHLEQPTLRRPGSSWGFGALLKGLSSVMDTSCRSQDSNPQPRVTSPTLYPLEPRLPRERTSSPRLGIETQVIHVTGGDTVHYTNEGKHVYIIDTVSFRN